MSVFLAGVFVAACALVNVGVLLFSPECLIFVFFWRGHTRLADAQGGADGRGGGEGGGGVGGTSGQDSRGTGRWNGRRLLRARSLRRGAS